MKLVPFRDEFHYTLILKQIKDEKNLYGYGSAV